MALQLQRDLDVAVPRHSLLLFSQMEQSIMYILRNKRLDKKKQQGLEGEPSGILYQSYALLLRTARCRVRSLPMSPTGRKPGITAKLC